MVFQDPMKYAKISVKYNNQIVTTLNKGFKGADSLNTYIRTENTPKTVPVAVSKPTVQKQEVVKSAPPKEKKKESIQSKETKKATKPEKKDNKNKK